ncbi:hypothetical protein CVT24_012047 [Panaeolus cyanescens]|uniref:Uncharacterized protein n=1 Tax=Panaeolus cyanescens TaxID=181874 RepID=A0A409YNA0_9AGAR|nr:hypothetical protein CVT24_012047 [Panaeolus cyanescens]
MSLRLTTTAQSNVNSTIAPSAQRLLSAFDRLRVDTHSPLFGILYSIFNLSAGVMSNWPQDKEHGFLNMLADLGNSLYLIYELQMNRDELELTTRRGRGIYRRKFIFFTKTCKSLLFKLADFFERSTDLIKFDDIIDDFDDYVDSLKGSSSFNNLSLDSESLSRSTSTSPSSTSECISPTFGSATTTDSQAGAEPLLHALSLDVTSNSSLRTRSIPEDLNAGKAAARVAASQLLRETGLTYPRY